MNEHEAIEMSRQLDRDDNLTWQEASTRMTWCEQTVKQLRERSESKAHAWWEKNCDKPAWLEVVPDDGENMHQFAERLEAELLRWAEAGLALIAEEEATELARKEEARRPLEQSLNAKRGYVELLQRSQSIPESERTVRGSDLRMYCGYVYLQEQWRLEGNHMVRSPNGPYKIGHTTQPKKRWDKLWKTEALMGLKRYATLIRVDLEQALHAHFDEFRIRKTGELQKGERKNWKGERFWLPPGEVKAFMATVAKIERWVLAIKVAQLELDIVRIEAALSRSHQQT